MAVAATTPIDLQTLEPATDSVLEFDDQHYPLLLISGGVGQLNAREALRLIRFCEDAAACAMDDGLRLVIVFDAEQSATPSSVVREIFVDWLRDSPLRDWSGSIRAVVVAPSLVMRGTVTSIKWATRCEAIQVAGDLDAAFALARAFLADVGQPLPAVLVDD